MHSPQASEVASDQSGDMPVLVCNTDAYLVSPPAQMSVELAPHIGLEQRAWALCSVTSSDAPDIFSMGDEELAELLESIARAPQAVPPPAGWACVPTGSSARRLQLDELD